MPTRQTKKTGDEEAPPPDAEEGTEKAAVEPAEGETSTTTRAKEEQKTMANRVDDAFDLIKGMTILELRALTKRVEDEFGITAAAPMAMAAPVPAAGGA